MRDVLPLPCGTGTRSPRVLGTAVLVLCGLAPARGLSQSCDGVNVEALYQQGRDLRESRRDQEALELFLRAYACRREPLGLARIALAEVALSRWLAAEEHLDEALRDTNSGWINQNRAHLVDMLQRVRTHIALLEVRSNVPEAELRVFGGLTYRIARRTTVRVVVTQEVTDLEIEVRAPEHRTERRSVRVSAGAAQTATVDVALESLRPESQPSLPPPVVGDDAGPGPWPWVMTAAGGAGVIAGVVVLAVPYRSADEEYDALCPDGVCWRDTHGASLETGQRAAVFQTLGWSLITSGSVALVCGLVWNFNEHLRRAQARPPSSSSSGARATLGVGLDGTLQLRGAF